MTPEKHGAHEDDPWSFDRYIKSPIKYLYNSTYKYSKHTLCCSNRTFTFVLSVKMSCTEIPAYQIPQENPEENEQILFQRGITERTGWWWEHIYFCIIVINACVLSDKFLCIGTLMKNWKNSSQSAVSSQQYWTTSECIVETTVRYGHKLKTVLVLWLWWWHHYLVYAILILCLVGEPMDAVCEEAGPREPSKVCQSEVKCPAVPDIQKEVAECPAITEVQKEVADAAPTGSETSRKDPVSVPDGRTAATAPKPGKKSKSLIKWLVKHLNNQCCSCSYWK